MADSLTMPEPAQNVVGTLADGAPEEGMTTWKAIGREISGQTRRIRPTAECGPQKLSFRQPLRLVEEELRAPSISHQLVYQISRGGGNLERENWLEHEVQPTDSEIESIYKGRSGGPEVQASMAPHAVVNCSDCDGEEDRSGEQKNGGIPTTPKSLARSIIDLSEPMSKEELLRTMDALRDIYQRKFGEEMDRGLPNTSITREAIERIDNEINELRTRMLKLSVQQHKLKGMANSEHSPSQASLAASNERKNSQHSGMYRSMSTASSEIRTPSPRDTAMFIPLDQDRDDMEEKLKQRDKLILRQLQRRENLLQRRVQRAAERRYLEEERRIQEQWIEKAKAEHDLRRNFILQSHQLEKQAERHFGTLPRNGKKVASQLQLFLNGREFSPDRDETFAKNKNGHLDPISGRQANLDVSTSRFMAPTAASQRRMNRAASLMSGLNSTELDGISLGGLATNGGSLHDLYQPSNDSSQHNYGHSNGNQRRESQTRLNAASHARLNGSTLSLGSNGRHSRSAGRTMTKTNRNYMINAITHVSLAGQANKKQREAVLQEIESSCARHFMILFRDHRLLYRALYTYSTDATSVEKIHGIGPMSVDESMIEKFFKYNSGNRSFVFIPARRFSIQCDAFIIHDEYWYKRANTTRR